MIALVQGFFGLEGFVNMAMHRKFKLILQDPVKMSLLVMLVTFNRVKHHLGPQILLTIYATYPTNCMLPLLQSVLSYWPLHQL